MTNIHTVVFLYTHGIVYKFSYVGKPNTEGLFVNRCQGIILQYQERSLNRFGLNPVTSLSFIIIVIKLKTNI